MNTKEKSKRILCYGDSNTWGWVPASMGSERYPIHKRWTGILQTLLGNDFEIIEEGLGGRTTMFDDPRQEFPQRNGLETLPIVLESHLPLDYVILMLGTTDTKQMMGLTSLEITDGMRKLITTVKNFKKIKGGSTPKILVVVPPIVLETTEFASKLFTGGTKKATELVDNYKQLCEAENVFYLNPTDEIKVDKNEGVHIDTENHQKLANLIYQKIKSLA